MIARVRIVDVSNCGVKIVHLFKNLGVCVRHLLVVGSLVALLSACGNDDDKNHDGAEHGPESDVEPVVNDAGSMGAIIVKLSPSQQVPPLSLVGAEAEANLTFDPASNILSGSVSASGLTGDATAAHIHKGFAGTNGGVALTLKASTVSNVFNVPDNTILSAEQVTTLNRGEWYINVHTESNRDGEVRGQIVTQDASVIWTDLSGDEVVPPINTDATGKAVLTWHRPSNTIWTSLSVTGIKATAAHIHEAFAGETGDIHVPLVLDPNNSSNWRADGVVLAPEQIESLQANKYYFNVHSNSAPYEIRGQIINTISVGPLEIK